MEGFCAFSTSMSECSMWSMASGWYMGSVAIATSEMLTAPPELVIGLSSAMVCWTLMHLPRRLRYLRFQVRVQLMR